MGYTKFTCDLIGRHLNGVKSVIDLGSQNLYLDNSDKPPFVSEWYKERNIFYQCIDLAGDNGALTIDLAKWPHKLIGIKNGRGTEMDIDEFMNIALVVDAGTSEHICVSDKRTITPFLGGHINSVYPDDPPTEKQIKQGYYNCWKIKFGICKIDGLIISENPLTLNWPGHGYSYLGVEFYDELIRIADLEVVEQGLEAATGNTKDGWNIWSVLRKTGNHFPSFKDFNNLPIFRT